MVSVIIPVYNAREYVRDALDSVLKQDVPMEIIVMDDCSEDGSADCVKTWISEKKTELLRRSVDIRLVENPCNLGVAETRNKGVLLARGEYVALLDADDRFADGKLKKQLSLLKKTGACLCNTGRVLIRPDGSNTGIVIETPRKITLKKLEKSNYINCSSVVARRGVMLRFPMEHSEVHEDYLTWLRLLKQYDYVVGINEPLLEYRLSKEGKSRNKWKSACMTYRTYRYAGYPLFRSVCMMVSYTIQGIKKYKIVKKH